MEPARGHALKIRKIIAVVFAFALVAGACGDDDGGDGFSSEVRQGYLAGCETEQPTAFCECTIDEIESRFTEEEFIRLAIEAAEDPPEEFTEIAFACLSKADLGG